MDRKKVTIPALHAKKRRGEPITMITAYDYPGALAVDEAGVDLILVGDSLGMVVLGYDSTVPVTMDEMIIHTAAVKRGTQYAHLVGDMPFLSYQADVKDAIRNAGRFLKEGRADSVKLEGGAATAPIVKAIVEAGIAVMGHIGLTPQAVSKLGGYRVQGKTARAAQQLLEDALALQEAGAYALVLETTPERVSEFVSQQSTFPPLASARARAAMGRCWSSTIYSATSIASRPGTTSATPTFARSSSMPCSSTWTKFTRALFRRLRTPSPLTMPSLKRLFTQSLRLSIPLPLK